MSVKKLAEIRAGKSKETSFWRLGCIAFLAISIILSIAVVITKKEQAEIFVVDMSSMNSARVINYTPIQNYTPQDMVIQQFIEDWIKKLRSVSIDPEVVRDNLGQVYQTLQGNTRSVVDNILEKNDIWAMSRTGIRIIPRIVIVYRQIDRGDVWNIEWEEIIYDTSGNLIDEKLFKGEILVKYVTPQTPEQWNKNPTGLWVFNFNMDEKRKE